MTVGPLFLLLTIFVSSVTTEQSQIHPRLKNDGDRDNPGITVKILDAGIDYLKKLILDVLTREAKSLVVPNIKQLFRGGQGWIRVYESLVKRFRRPKKMDIVFRKSDEMSITVKDFDISMAGKIRGQYQHYRAKGTYAADLKHIENTLKVKLHESRGRPQIYAHSCEMNIKDINLNVRANGLVDLVFNLLRTKVTTAVKALIEKGMCKHILNILNEDINKALKDIPLRIRMSKSIDLLGSIKRQKRAPSLVPDLDVRRFNFYREIFDRNPFKLDYSLIKKPRLSRSQKSMTLFHKGQIISGRNRSTPFAPQAMGSDKVSSSKAMVQLYVSDYVLNAIFYRAFERGLLKLTVSARTHPKLAPLLRTKCGGESDEVFSFCIGDLLDGVPEAFPGKQTQIVITADRAPAVFFGANSKATFDLHGSFVIHVIDYNKSKLYRIVDADLHMVAEMKLHFDGSHVKGDLKLKKQTLRLRQGYFDSFKQHHLDDIAFFGSHVVGEMASKVLQRGLRVPRIAGLTMKPIRDRIRNRHYLMEGIFSIDDRLAERFLTQLSRRRRLRRRRTKN